MDAVDKGAYGAGAALIRKAIEANPAAASCHVDLAHALEHQGRLEETVEAYRRALEIDPGDARAHKNLGHVLNVLDRPRFQADVPGFGSTDCRICPAHLLTVRLSRP